MLKRLFNFAALLSLGLMTPPAMASHQKEEPITLSVVCMPTDTPQFVGGGPNDVITTPLVYAQGVLKQPIVGLFSHNKDMENFVKDGNYYFPPVRLTFMPTPDNIQLLGNYTGLVALDLSICRLNEGHVKALICMLQNLKNLQILNLAHNCIMQGTSLLAPVISQLDNLTSLDMTKTLPGVPFIECLPQLKKLTRLVLRQNYIRYEEAILLSNVLKQMPQLVFLDLAENALDPQRQVFRTLAALGNLEHLDLYETGIKCDDLPVLAFGLQNKPRLKNLNLSYNYFGDINCKMKQEDITTIAKIIGSLNTLEELNVSHSNLGEEATAAVISALKNHSGLRRLLLNSNRISKKGIMALELVLPELASLEELYLYPDSPARGETDNLFEAALKHPSLTRVDIWPDFVEEKARYTKRTRV